MIKERFSVRLSFSGDDNSGSPTGFRLCAIPLELEGKTFKEKAPIIQKIIKCARDTSQTEAVLDSLHALQNFAKSHRKKSFT